MEVFVNGVAIELFHGMTVRHALIRTGQLDVVVSGGRVSDEWGNEMGLDGALKANDRITVKEK